MEPASFHYGIDPRKEGHARFLELDERSRTWRISLHVGRVCRRAQTHRIAHLAARRGNR